MKLSRSHLQFWNEQKAPKPKWAQTLKPIITRTTDINELINFSAGLRFPTEPANTIVLLKHARARSKESMMDMLDSMSQNPGTVCDPQIRKKMAYKWGVRIFKEGLKQIYQKRLDTSSKI